MTPNWMHDLETKADAAERKARMIELESEMRLTARVIARPAVAAEVRVFERAMLQDRAIAKMRAWVPWIGIGCVAVAGLRLLWVVGR